AGFAVPKSVFLCEAVEAPDRPGRRSERPSRELVDRIFGIVLDHPNGITVPSIQVYLSEQFGEDGEGIAYGDTEGIGMNPGLINRALGKMRYLEWIVEGNRNGKVIVWARPEEDWYPDLDDYEEEEPPAACSGRHFRMRGVAAAKIASIRAAVFGQRSKC